jgi:hypothetical protein
MGLRDIIRELHGEGYDDEAILIERLTPEQ